MRLFLLRHGIPVEQGDWKGDDRDRPLAGEGSRRMKRQARALRRVGVRPDLIVASPYVRARQTAEIVAQGLGMGSVPLVDNRLAPGFEPGALARLLEAHGDLGSLLLVGHEPDFGRIIGSLIGGGKVDMPKGCLAALEVADPRSLRGTLLWLAPPEILDP